MLGSILDDIRFSLRRLVRQPATTLAAVATLALGTGATTAMYTVVDGVLLRPLPFPEADRLVALCETHESVAQFCVASPPNARDWARDARTLTGVGLARDWSFRIARGGGPTVRAATGIATAPFFRVLGVTPALGRLFSDEDEALERDVAVLSHELWTGAFGADSALVGGTLLLDGRPFEVIGVLPPDLEVPEHGYVRLWAPLHAGPEEPPGREWRGFQALGRLAAGASIASATAELAALQRGLAEQHPESNAGWGIRVVSAQDRVVGGVRATLLVFLGAAAVLLLAACANVANLLLARGAQRGREFAVRAAVGAGSGRLFRLVAVEAGLLAAAGGVLGLALAVWATDAFLALAPPGLPRASAVGVDARVLVGLLGIVVVAGLVAGVGPAWRAMRTDLAGAMRRGQQAGLEHGALGLRGGFVAAQVALAFVLAVGAGLLARSWMRYQRWDPGFDRANIATFWLLVPPESRADRAAVVAQFERIREELRSVPGVQVGMASSGPLFGGVETDEFEIGGAGGRPYAARWYDVWPEFHATLGVALRRGRWLAASDRDGAPLVALVNETFARQAFPGQDPVGGRVRRKDDGAELTIVGVVADVPPLTPGQAVEPELYWPFLQWPRWGSFVVLRTPGDPMAVMPAVRERLRAIHPDLDPASVQTMAERAADRLRRPRFNLLLIGAFALTALTLGVIGVAGVTAATVAQRTREFGVRVALGARAGDVVRMVLRQALGLTLGGIAAGVAVGLVATRLARAAIPGVRPGDPATFVAVAALLAGVVLLACLPPARQAGRIDPSEALRAE